MLVAPRLRAEEGVPSRCPASPLIDVRTSGEDAMVAAEREKREGARGRRARVRGEREGSPAESNVGREQQRARTPLADTSASAYHFTRVPAPTLSLRPLRLSIHS